MLSSQDGLIQEDGLNNHKHFSRFLFEWSTRLKIITHLQLMRRGAIFLLFYGLAATIFAQSIRQSVTLPILLDHNRIIIDVTVASTDGKSKQVRAWVDNGDPGFTITEDLARWLGIPSGDKFRADTTVFGSGNLLYLGKKPVDLSKFPIAEIVPNMTSVGAEMNIPSTVLRNFDVTVDYPHKELTITDQGMTRFRGRKLDAIVNEKNALIQIPGNIDGNVYNLALDLGTPVCFISDDLMPKFKRNHPEWPHMIGAISIANLWGLDGEPHGDLLRIPEINYGGIVFQSVIAASFEKSRFDYFERRAGIQTIGLFGADAFLNFKIGIDYLHSAVYIQKITEHPPTRLEVVGIILRPETDDRYTIIGVAEKDGKPSVPGVNVGDVLEEIDGKPVAGLTMGAVWGMLNGIPGLVRILTVERGKERFKVEAKIRWFL